MSVQAQYEAAAELTHRMLEAARRQDWDDLTAASTQRDNVLAPLIGTLPPMSVSEGRQVARLIEEILMCHAEISERTGSWLEHTATLLAAFERVSTAPSPEIR